MQRKKETLPKKHQDKSFSSYQCYYFADVICSSLPQVGPNILINGTSVSYGSSLTFTCCAGYQLNGSLSSSCNGNWDATDVQCEGIFFSLNV
jgi:hypothetical protein